MLLSLISLSLLLAVWALSASRLERWRITSPMFLLLAGAVVEYTTHGSLADLLDSETAEQAAKIILAVLLFVDANAMRAGLFGEHPRSATRLLFVALPLSVGFAVLLGLWLLPGLSLATVVVIACIVVPIDFAPAQWIVRPGGVPGRVSDLLNVEAGYNDGILSPIFIFALAVADQHVQAGSAWDEVRQAFPHSAKAILVGLVVGAGLAMAANMVFPSMLALSLAGKGGKMAIVAVGAAALAIVRAVEGRNQFDRHRVPRQERRRWSG